MGSYGKGFKRARPREFIPFTGEMMKCELCGKQEQSDVREAKGWRCITLDGVPVYICRNEVAPRMSTEEWTAIYVDAISRFVARTPDYKAAKKVVVFRERFGGGVSRESMN